MKAFLDSGAYSAWAGGHQIDVHEYATFARRTQHHWHWIANLDVIDQDNPERAARLSDANLQVLRDAGINAMPVFHQGEDWRWLEKMISEGAGCIGLAAFKKGNPRDERHWLNDVFTILDKNTKTHAFALTSQSNLTRYPLTTADSTTWMKQSGFGQIPVPHYKDGQPDFRLPPMLLPITDQSTRYFHLDTLEDWQRHMVERWLNDIGIVLAQAMTTPEYRWRIWVAFFVRLQKSSGVEIVFGMNLDQRQKRILRDGGATAFLLSYWNLRHHKPNKIEALVVATA